MFSMGMLNFKVGSFKKHNSIPSFMDNPNKVKALLSWWDRDKDKDNCEHHLKHKIIILSKCNTIFCKHIQKCYKNNNKNS